METEEQTENIRKMKGNSGIGGFQILVISLLLLDMGVAVVLITDVLWQILPLWLAIIIAIPTGVIFIISAYNGEDASNIVIQNIIILILAAVLYPVFRHARERAKQAQEQHFQRQRQRQLEEQQP